MWFRSLLGLGLVVASAGAQPVCNSLEEARQHQGQRVVLMGRYEPEEAVASKGPTGVPGFQPGKRPYARSHITLVGGQVGVDPPLSKTSLRSPEEREDFGGQWVKATGIVHSTPQPYLEIEDLVLALPESKEFEPRSLLDRMEGISRWKFVSQELGPAGSSWDLCRDYLAQMDGAEFRIRAYRYPAGPPRPAPKPLPNGLQVAYSTAGSPAYVGRVELNYTGQPAAWSKMLQSIAEHGFGASPAQLAWLAHLNCSETVTAEKDGLSIEIKPGKCALWGGEPLPSRRRYLVLEPRTRRRP